MEGHYYIAELVMKNNVIQKVLCSMFRSFLFSTCHLSNAEIFCKASCVFFNVTMALEGSE